MSYARTVRKGPLAPAVAVAVATFASAAHADRIAVLAIESPGHAAPVVDADAVAAALLARGHRTIASPDASARLTAGDEGAGVDWAAQTIAEITNARAALTRLDRAAASNASRRIGQEIARRGGGAGGADVLVEWALLEQSLAATASDAAGGAEWLDTAVAFGPSTELDPLRHPDDERDRFAARRTALRAEIPASISIATTPPAAEVWVDGVHRCASPCAVSVVPGRHFVRISSPAHAPASLEVELGPGATVARSLGLSAAYAGASPKAIAAMFADPSRRAEGASALEPMARFLDVEHVVAIVPEGDDSARIVVAPPAAGRQRLGPSVPKTALATSVLEQLRPLAPAPGSEPPSPWYGKPGVWIGGAALVGAVVGGILLYESSRSSSTPPAPGGSLTVTSP